MTEKRTIDNSDRPGQPEPGEDEATQQPSAREEGGNLVDIERAKKEERERQTGE